ncbi:MAG: HEAT repeat domain-containing protein, partial [Anaerolineales bacterium]|nr:HEAT repeat domain-containing protein [Anaerolineales bacterium]
MTRFIPKIFLDFPSFWAGIFLAALILYIFFKYRSKIINFFSRTTKQVRSFRDNLSITPLTEYNQILYKYVQGKHLASKLLPLEHILVPPKCIAPSPVAIPGEETIDPSLLQQTLGYDPAYPDFAIEYYTPTFTLLDALSKGANICILGFPGSGKTVAIADSITTLATGESKNPYLSNKVAFLVEAQHILQQFPGSDILLILLTAIQANPAFSTIPNFPKFLTATINNENAILFIDGLDTLSHVDTNRVANYIIALCKKIPSLQVVAAASPSYLGNLTKSSLEPVSIAPWGQKEKYQFLEKWSDRFTTPQIQTPSDQFSDPAEFTKIRNSLLVTSGQNLTPLEFTLLAWAAYSDDLSGPTAINAIDSYLSRILNTLSQNTVRTLENIALHALDQEKSSFTKRDINIWLSNIDASSPELYDEKTSPLNRGIQIALYFDLLQKTGSDGFFFTHPTIAGFLASKGLCRSNRQVIQRIVNQPDWSLVHETMRYFSAFNPVQPYLNQLTSDPSLLKDGLLRACSWLIHLKGTGSEEQQILRSATKEIFTNPIYMVKLRLTIALAKSGNPNTGTIFRHLLQTNNADTRRAVAFGLGYIHDLLSIPMLINQMRDPFPASVAACYALGKISSPKSLEAIADSLLHGTELLRRAAAESLAQNRSEGHPALREGITRDDLLVRYAVVHGLSIINEPWAIDILDTMRIDENEWVVRDLAQHVFEILETESPYLPIPQPPAHKSAWLTTFSEQHDLTVVSAQTALDLLLTALEKGTDEQKQAALSNIRRLFNPEHIPALLKLLNDPNPVIAHQAALTLWFCLPPGHKITPMAD